MGIDFRERSWYYSHFNYNDTQAIIIGSLGLPWVVISIKAQSPNTPVQSRDVREYRTRVNGVDRADSRFAPGQWETSLQSNAVSHWLGTNLESDLRWERWWTPNEDSYYPPLHYVIYRWKLGMSEVFLKISHSPRCGMNVPCVWEGCFSAHYNDVIMGAMVSQITSITIVYTTVYSGTDQRKHQSSASLALCGDPPPPELFRHGTLSIKMITVFCG